MSAVRFKQERGCKKCNIPVPNAGDCCPLCGGIFSAIGTKGTIELDWVWKQDWIEVQKVWWKPSTWDGGYWQWRKP